MRSYILLLAVAALSEAFYYPEDGSLAPPMVKSRHFRRKTKLDEGSVCAPKAVADHIKFQTLNTTDISLAEAMLLSWTNDASSQLQNTGGSKGQVVTSGSVDAQVCNLSHDQRHISSDDLKVLFEALNCGSRDAPQMGFGYTDALDDNGYYVSYAPTGQLMDCFNDEGALEKAD